MSLDSLVVWAGRLSPTKVGIFLGMVGLLLVLPSLSVGLEALDDTQQRNFVVAKLAGAAAVAHRPWYDLYNLVSGDHAEGIRARSMWFRPWWASSEVKIRFFRPIAAALLYLDYGVFGERYWLAHLHSAMWYFLACFTVTVLMLRLSEDRLVALSGAALFVTDDAHASPVTWLAGRNAVVGVTFLALALLCYDSGCRSNKSGPIAAAIACLLMALLAAENVTSGLSLFIAYALFIDRRTLLRRTLPLLAVLVAVAGWYCAHTMLGFGTNASGSYLDPIRDWSAFCFALPERYLTLLNIQFAAPWPLHRVLPAWLLMGIQRVMGWVVFPSLVLFLVRTVDKRREIAFWTFSAVLGLLPLTAANPHERLLMHVGIPLWMLVAHLFVATLRRAAKLEGTMRVGVAGTVCLFFCVFTLMSSVALAVESAPRTTSGFVVPALASDRRSFERDVILVNVPDVLTPLEIMREHTGRHLSLPRRFAVLGGTIHEVEVTRIDSHTIELYSPPGYLLDTFASFWRGPGAPMHQGERIRVEEYTALIVRTTPDGRPLRIRFRFDRALEDPSLRFMYWTGHTLEDFDFGPVGKRRVIPADFDHSAQLPEDLVK